MCCTSSRSRWMASVGFSSTGWKGAMKAPKRSRGPNMDILRAWVRPRLISDHLSEARGRRRDCPCVTAPRWQPELVRRRRQTLGRKAPEAEKEGDRHQEHHGAGNERDIVAAGQC